MNWIQSVSDDGLIQIIHHEHVNRASHLRAVRACRDFSVEPRKNSLEHSAETSKKINIDRNVPVCEHSVSATQKSRVLASRFPT